MKTKDKHDFEYMTFKEAALQYADLGLPVFPLKPKSKAPRIDKWPQKATTNKDIISKWWTDSPDSNIAIVTGKLPDVNHSPRYLFVVDSDEHDPEHSGSESLIEWEDAHGLLPDTCEVLTGGGGVHKYYYSNHPIRSRTGILPGVDIKGEGGYILAPPSVHPDTGKKYLWESSLTIGEQRMTLADSSDSLLKLIQYEPLTYQSQRVVMPDRIQSGERNEHLFRLACSLQSQGLDDASITAAVQAENTAKCSPPLDAGEVGSLLASAFNYPKGSAKAKRAPGDLRPPDGDYTESGQADLFAKQYGSQARWCKSLGWAIYNGKQWTFSDAAALGQIKELTNRQLRDAIAYNALSVASSSDGSPSPEAKAYLKYANKMRSNSSTKAALDLSRPSLEIRAKDFDRDAFLLNTPDGIVNLKTGKMREHDPALLCTMMTASGLQEINQGQRKIWADFLDTISTDPDLGTPSEDMKTYLQKSVGSTLIGKVQHEGIQIALGAGRNGKSTFYNAILKTLGDYAGTIDISVMTTTTMNKGAAKATLRGKRLVTCSELEEGQRLSTQTLKQLASTDPLIIEAKYKDPEEIEPSHHIIMMTNHLPRVGSTDDGTWRRITIIPFKNSITITKELPNYADTLFREAGPAILEWCVEGARLFIQDGCKLIAPPGVQEATQEYRRQEDWLQDFIDQRCEIAPGRQVQVGGHDGLYDAYKRHSEASGIYTRSMPDFNRAMERKGFKSVKAPGHIKIWLGIGLKWP